MTLWIKLAIIGIVLGSLYTGHVYLVHNAVEDAKAVQKAEFDREILENIIRSNKVTSNIKQETEELIIKKNEKITNITRERNRLNRLLKDRPSRPSNPSTLPPTSGSSCTGRELYRTDGEFLTGEAARAERIMEERNFYYEQYEQARKKIDELNRTK